MQDALKLALSPYSGGGLRLRNRVVLPAHTTNFALHNRPTERHAAYLAQRARGGVGLIVTEAVRVHPSSAGRHLTLGCFDDDCIDDYARLVEAVHHEGSAFFAQIMHAGRQANGDATRTAAWSASAIPWTTGAYPPHAMSHADIATVVQAFADAARRMRAAGFDGLEVHLGHGHLLQQFLSPVTNHRSDQYGGSPLRRLTIVRETLDAIRSTADDMPIALRISANEFLPGGLDPEQMVEILHELTGDGFQPAYLNVSHSAYQGDWTLSTQIADMHFDHAQFSDHAGYFKRHMPETPILAVCRLDSLAEAAELLARGDCDLVGLVRPHIANPNLVIEAEHRELSPGRSCLACNQACIARVEQNLPISCVVNPEVGYESNWNQVRDTQQARQSTRHVSQVLVVGGGVAGMEAALASERSGHDVTLIEASRHLGGQVSLAASLSGRQRLGLLVSDQVREVQASGIHLELDTTADDDLVRNEKWDEVIIATGSMPSQRYRDERVTCLDVWQAVDVATGHRDLGPGSIVVVDDEGGWIGAGLYEALATLGRHVHVVSSDGLATKITTYSRLALIARIQDLHVNVHLLSTARITGQSQVSITHKFNDDVIELPNVAAIVDAGPLVAADRLYRSFDETSGRASVRANVEANVQIIGDANAPRTAFEAVYEGRVAGTFFGRIQTHDAKSIASII